MGGSDAIENKRLAYRLGDKLPKPIRIIYYILLTITLIYWLYRVITGLITLIQKIGSFLFEKRNYYTFVVCLLILAIGVFLASQFIFNLDPLGKLGNWFNELWQDIRRWCARLIGG